MKLNRWQRIGVVISMLWALGAAYNERTSEMDAGQKFIQLAYQTCTESEPSIPRDCLAEMTKNIEIWMKPNWANISFIAFAPILLGWILVFIIIRVYRWIKAGEV